MANRYWVGGTANWDGTAGTKWATSSGGLGGASVPTSADDVFFTNLSTGTCTISAGNTGAKSINCTGFTGTIAGTAAITVAGSVTLVAGMTYTYTGTLTISATATLTSGGKTHGSITLSAGTLTLGDACTLGATNTFTLTAGTIALNTFTLSTGIFSSSNSNTRSITFGSANIALTSTTAATTVLSMATATNFTMTTSGGGFTRNMAATATLTFGTTGGTVSNAPNMSFTAGSAQISITINSWFKNLNFTGNTSSTTGSGTINIAGNLTLSASGNYTPLIPTFFASGTITSNGATLGGNITINGAGITITLAGALTSNGISFTLTQGALDLANNTLTVGTFVSNTSNTRSISFGSGNIVCTNTTPGIVIVNMATATNFTYTGTGGFRRNSTTTSTVIFGTTAGATASNAPNFTATGGTSAITLTNSYLKNVNLSAMTGGSGTGGAVNIYGNLTLGGGHSFTSLEPTFLASGTLTSSGKTLGNITVNGSGITVTLADAMTSNNTLTLTQGTFDAANFNVTTVYFSSNNSNTRTLNMGTGTWTVSGGSAFTTWNTSNSTNLTVNASTSTITMTNASAKIFAGGGKTYYNLNQGGAGALTISGSNTFNNITNSTQPATVTFTAGTTQTVSAFGLSGTAGNLITINSTTPGSQFTLSDPSGTINAQYLAIRDSNATGGAVWNALLSNGNVDNGNNTGWIFAGSNFFMFFM